MSMNDIQRILSQTPYWINFEQSLALEKPEDTDRKRYENLSWRSWHCKQQKHHIVQPQTGHQKFFLSVEHDSEEEEEEEDDCSSSSSSLFDEDQEEWYNQPMKDDLVFEKIHCDRHLYLSEINKTSLLSQMLQNSANDNQQNNSQQLLKRCQSKYQCLNQWFTTSA
ncbi:uncharacterized protein B0P05DRAFT_560090 [Gilbertella persicaria]|uniref:Nitrogen regulatory protein areA GATA-like domain-containing protein n=1 Tax=Rhizopus stolonifer TaxID=4846 RepID=A0A367KEI9_RHIST|nr:uncharacterized protein B0P05DRAFT_560090 [Gilbertella persicaria]KAI8056541.1 hypothetical protein B0P05DRAFT_560090 [Gilbertella persicaria]RCI00635.1 hypothetical protein CU098_009636 [Rhizopus stolonifer]